MLYRFYVPSAPFDTFVQDFWSYDGARPTHLKDELGLITEADER